MNIIIPMAGAGQRFLECGYKTHKPAIQVTNRRTGEKHPMVVCATMDLPGVDATGKNLIYIERTFHKADGVENQIKTYYPKAKFIAVELLTEGQACTCLLARKHIDNSNALLIAGCDNGMEMDFQKFEKECGKSDVLVFTYRNDESVCANPDAYGWVEVNSDNKITGVSVKKAISDTPMKDHAIVATFWFKEGSMFIKAVEKMIRENDRINNEFYVDEAIKHCLDLGYNARIFEVERYIGWGTPRDYEAYQNTIEYWSKFVESDGFIPKICD